MIKYELSAGNSFEITKHLEEFVYERPIKYPCAIAEPTKDGIVAAFNWLVSKMEENDEFTLWVPLKSTLNNDYSLQKLMRESSGRVVATNQIHHANGVILAMYPGVDELTCVTGAQKIRALAVVRWADNLDTWTKEVNATVLQTSDAPIERKLSPYEQEPELKIEIVKSLEHVTKLINIDNTITGRSFEKRIVVRALLELHDSGIELPPTRMAEWAIAHGWQGKNPKRLRDYARRINEGARPRTS